MELSKQGLGTCLRPMFFKDVEWGNHFVSPSVNRSAQGLTRARTITAQIHYDYPEEFVEILGECVHQLRLI